MNGSINGKPGSVQIPRPGVTPTAPEPAVPPGQSTGRVWDRPAIPEHVTPQDASNCDIAGRRAQREAE